jgi:hypothetical protein
MAWLMFLVRSGNGMRLALCQVSLWTRARWAPGYVASLSQIVAIMPLLIRCSAAVIAAVARAGR